MPNYYIHVTDPGFAEPPFPGVRRLGPYGSKQEAEAQAAHDRSVGVAVAGVYTERDSEAKRGND